MRRALIGLTVLVLATGTASAKKGWKDFAGRGLPSFKVEEWLNTDVDVQPGDLKGKVWMLRFMSVG